MIKTIFDNKKEFEDGEEWFFSEIAELYDCTKSPEKQDIKRFENAARNLNTKVRINTRLKNYFIIKNDYFQINKDCL